MSVLLELCRSHNSIHNVGIFREMYALLVLSGLFFLRRDGGVASNLIDMVDDVNGVADYNWSAVVWEFLVDTMEEMKKKMRTTKNLQINGFPMILQVGN